MRTKRHSYFLLIPVGSIVLAFMGLSLAITATGTARFAVAMGYRPGVGYAVGAVFDFAKALLPVALLLLFSRRAFFSFGIIGFAWLGLVAYSALATHATVSTAIADIERTGSWKMEVRSDTKAELATVEKRLEVLSQPAPPRPTKSLVEALEVEKVPPGVWRDSQECLRIRDSRYFQKACTKVLELRRELAAAKDYELLDVKVRELRQALARTPLVAESDPLPEAFAATLGRLLPLDGRSGIALLLTVVIEIMSCFGLSALRALGEDEAGEDQRGIGTKVRNRAARINDCDLSQIVPKTSLAASGVLPDQTLRRPKPTARPSNIIPLPAAKPRDVRTREGLTKPPRKRGSSLIGSHVLDFAGWRLQSFAGTSLGASDLYAEYKAWCAANNETPVSMQKLGAELTGLGFAKWKSCGRIRYRDLQIAA